MSPPPRLTIAPPVVRENVKRVRARVDVDVVGVTKAVRGHPAVGAAMLAGGATSLADARVENLQRLGHHVDGEQRLLRIPMASRVEDVLAHADLALHAERSVIDAVAESAGARGVVHDIVTLVDAGDRREGVLPDDLVRTCEFIERRSGVRLVGLATHSGSFAGVLPTAESVATFVDRLASVENAIGRELPVVSGGSTVTLPLAERGELPDRVTELRLGESILLGTDVSRDRRIPYLQGDAVAFHAEVIELRRKPTTPTGPRGQAVDGRPRRFEDRGKRLRAVLAVGTQDTDPAGLRPLADGIEVVGASSDHMVLDVEGAASPPAPGETVAFRPSYAALARAVAAAGVAVDIQSRW